MKINKAIAGLLLILNILFFLFLLFLPRKNETATKPSFVKRNEISIARPRHKTAIFRIFGEKIDQGRDSPPKTTEAVPQLPKSTSQTIDTRYSILGQMISSDDKLHFFIKDKTNNRVYIAIKTSTLQKANKESKADKTVKIEVNGENYTIIH